MWRFSARRFALIAGVAATLAARRPRTRTHMAGDLAALMITLTIPGLMGSPLWGPLQRLMFPTAATKNAEKAMAHPGSRNHL